MTIRIAHIASLLATTLLVTTAFAAPKDELDAAMSHDGLSKITVKDIDLVYARPGATLAAYKKVKLDPTEVSFRKDWNPKRPGSSFKLSDEERENIRTGVGKLVQEELARELQARNGYPVVSQAGPDVLRVRANILNLYVNAPDTKQAGVRTYSVSAGEMTLVMELYDSETGQVLARIVDRREARGGHGSMTLSNRVENTAEARDIALTWARILRKGLDKAKTQPSKP